MAICSQFALKWHTESSHDKHIETEKKWASYFAPDTEKTLKTYLLAKLLQVKDNLRDNTNGVAKDNHDASSKPFKE